MKSVKKALRRISSYEVPGKTVVVTGYSQSYGVYVHENLTARHKEGKSAKFLERPARQLRGELNRIVRTVFKKTKDISKALIVAGLRLQRESQKIVPVDTSALRASAFTAESHRADTQATLARFRSNVIRSSVLRGRREATQV